MAKMIPKYITDPEFIKQLNNEIQNLLDYRDPDLNIISKAYVDIYRNEAGYNILYKLIHDGFEKSYNDDLGYYDENTDLIKNNIAQLIRKNIDQFFMDYLQSRLDD